MKVRGHAATRPAALRARIRTVERRIGRRRDNIGVAMESIAHHVRDQATSPVVIIGAGLVGVAIHRGNLLRGLQPMALFRTANSGLRMLLKVASPALAAAGDTEAEDVPVHTHNGSAHERRD